MRQEKELNVSNVHEHTIDARRRIGINGKLQAISHSSEAKQDQPDSPFPYLETIVAAAKKYPYAAVGVMISIAAVVISAVTVLSVSVIGGMFLMYGEMRQNTATMRENQATMLQILNKQQTIENRQIDAGNIMRAYEAANGKRVEFMVGLMSPGQQRAMNAYNRSNPMPNATSKESNKEN